MKIALIKTKLSTEPTSSNQQQANSKKKTEKPKPQKKSKEKIKTGTYLTLIGVCTTVRPEKSGT
jgi:hypothetical protein